MRQIAVLPTPVPPVVLAVSTAERLRGTEVVVSGAGVVGGTTDGRLSSVGRPVAGTSTRMTATVLLLRAAMRVRSRLRP